MQTTITLYNNIYLSSTDMTAFSLGGVHIYWYGVFYFITCLCGYGFLWRVGKQKRFAGYPGIQKLLTSGLDDLILWTIVGVLIGGRLGHVLIYERPYYVQHPKEIFAVRRGGMSFIGGIVGVVLAILHVERMYKLSKNDLFIVFDLLLLVIPIGIILGRIGNFLNQELYGIVVPESLQRLSRFKITHVYPKIDGLLRFNTNFIAAFLEGLVIWIVGVVTLFKQLSGKYWKPGLITISFIIVYSVVRFLLEFLRQDSQYEYVGIFTTTQRFMICFLGFGLTLWHLYGKEKNKNR